MNDNKNSENFIFYILMTFNMIKIYDNIVINFI